MQKCSEQTVIALSNACALATEVISELAGTVVAETLNGTLVSRRTLCDLVASEIGKNYQQCLIQLPKQN